MIKYATKPTLVLKDLFNIRLNQDPAIFNSYFSNQFPGSKIIPLNYARSGIVHVIKSLGISDKEILLPAYICRELEEVFIETGNRPVFVDSHPDTFNMDLELIPELITTRTKVIIAPHIFGNPLDRKTLLKIRKDYGLLLIEDCAHSLGGRDEKGYLGGYGDASVFSLYKFIPTIRGALLVVNTNYPKIDFIEESESITALDIFRLIYSLDIVHRVIPGLKESAHERISKKIFVKRLNPIFSSLTENFIPKLDMILEKRRNVSTWYEKKLASNFKLQKVMVDHTLNRPSFPILLDEDLRNLAFDSLKEKGIGCEKLWEHPLIQSKTIQQNYRVDPLDYPVANQLSKRILNLPIQWHYPQVDVDFIVRSLIESGT